MVAIEDKEYADAQTWLDQANREIQALEDSHDKVYGLLNIGLAYNDLKKGMASTGPSSSSALQAPTEAFQQSVNPFKSAAAIAQRLGDARGESYALGYWGHLLEQAHQFDAALDLTDKAIFSAQKANAPESLYRWHWQRARLLMVLGREDEALLAYQRAVNILQPIRHEFSLGYQGRRHSFRESVWPLFAELVDLLLRRGGSAQNLENSQEFLRLARTNTEVFKAAELQDYFHDECVKTAQVRPRP